MTLVEHKRFSGIASDCHSCIINQASSAARFANLNDDQTGRIVSVAKAGMAESETEPIMVQHVIRRVADSIIAELGESPEFDIYAGVKEQSNKLSMACADKFQAKIDGSKSPLETGLQIAAAGNIIDFGAKNTQDAIDLEKELRLLDQTPFDIYDFESLNNKLSKAGLLLYICDNSGEIVFDMLFIKAIKRVYPDIEIVAALRDKPIINDATIEDAKAVGLDRVVKTISSGSIYPGTILSETSDEFNKYFTLADVILSKGQGNFETLLEVADKRLFFLLRIKCEYMASLSGAEKDNLVLMQCG